MKRKVTRTLKVAIATILYADLVEQKLLRKEVTVSGSFTGNKLLNKIKREIEPNVVAVETVGHTINRYEMDEAKFIALADTCYKVDKEEE